MSRPALAAAMTTVALAAVALVGPPLHAQMAPAAPVAPAAPEPAGSWVASAGTDAAGRDHLLGRHTGGLAVQAGYQRRLGPAQSRFAVRLAGDYWRSGGNTYQRINVSDLASPYTFRRTTSIVGGSVLGVMHLRTGGAFRPYALAGVGVYQYSGVNETAPIRSGAFSATVVDNPGDRITSFAYSGGVGASLHLGRVTPFAELRMVRLTGQAMTNSSVSPVRMPLALGVRVAF
jgi:opacity protein-like surface antigen